MVRAIWWSTVLGACTAGGKITGGGDGGDDGAIDSSRDTAWSESDADTDADTDSDTDADTYTDLGEALRVDDAAPSVITVSTSIIGDATVAADGLSMAGAIEYDTSRGGIAECDFTVTVGGPAYTGDCEGCDFAFSTNGVISRDASSSACRPEVGLSLAPGPSDYEKNLFIAFWSSYTSPYSYYGYYGYYGSYTDLFRVGYALDFSSSGYGYSGGYYPGPYWFTHSHSGTAPSRTFSKSGSTLHWEWTDSYTYTDYSFYRNYCGYSSYAYASSSYIVSTTSTGSIPCDDSGTVDVWEFTANAGDEVVLSVDTVATATAFDAILWVNGPDTCTLASADDSFACTFPPPAYECPSIRFTATQTGTHEAVVGTLNTCASSVAEYTIDILSVD